MRTFQIAPHIKANLPAEPLDPFKVLVKDETFDNHGVYKLSFFNKSNAVDVLGNKEHRPKRAHLQIQSA